MVTGGSEVDQEKKKKKEIDTGRREIKPKDVLVTFFYPQLD